MFSNPTAVTFIGYLIVMVGVGVFAYYYTRSYTDFILGGRSLGGFVTALSVGASDMSGWLLMGLPGAVFLFGVSQSWIAIGLILGSWLNWRFAAARLRVYTEKAHNSLTLPDYLTHRFEDKSNALRIIASAVILIFFTIYCASGVVAGARLFENTFHMEYETHHWCGSDDSLRVHRRLPRGQLDRHHSSGHHVRCTRRYPYCRHVRRGRLFCDDSTSD